MGRGVTALHAHAANALAGGTLDRAHARREDAAFLAAALDDPATGFLPVWRGRNLVLGMTEARPYPAVLARGELPVALPEARAFLGLDAGRALFAVDLSPLDVPLAEERGAFEDLWRVGGLMAPAEAALLGHARALMHWHRTHGFCGVCGAACAAGRGGHVRRCTGCGADHFPRTDPAVIMLVTRGERALLARSKRFRNIRMFSTLAGFVEPGESLEEAVAREVWEEAGVEVADVRYHSSQPWPFPASIMLGFRAEARGEAITLDDDELLEAAWFTRAALRAPGDFALPPDFSIARRLIDTWLDE